MPVCGSWLLTRCGFASALTACQPISEPSLELSSAAELIVREHHSCTACSAECSLTSLLQTECIYIPPLCNVAQRHVCMPIPSSRRGLTRLPFTLSDVSFSLLTNCDIPGLEGDSPKSLVPTPKPAPSMSFPLLSPSPCLDTSVQS